jgi:hypothetical protein
VKRPFSFESGMRRRAVLVLMNFRPVRMCSSQNPWSHCGHGSANDRSRVHCVSHVLRNFTQSGGSYSACVVPRGLAMAATKQETKRNSNGASHWPSKPFPALYAPLSYSVSHSHSPLTSPDSRSRNDILPRVTPAPHGHRPRRRSNENTPETAL